MAHDGGDRHLRRDGAWSPFVAMCGVLAAVGLLGVLALPHSTVPMYATYHSRDFIHGEWLVLAGLLALPIYRAARAGWWTALPVCVVASAQVLFVADTAVDAMRRVGQAHALDQLWYVLAGAEAVIFVAAAVVGAGRDLRDRRWVRLMRDLTDDRAPRRGEAAPRFRS